MELVRHCCHDVSDGTMVIEPSHALDALSYVKHDSYWANLHAILRLELDGRRQRLTFLHFVDPAQKFAEPAQHQGLPAVTFAC